MNAPIRERLRLRGPVVAALTILPAMFFAAGGAPTAQFPSCPGIAGVSMWRGAVSFSYGHQLQDSVARLDLSQSASGVGVLTQAPGGPFWSGSTRGTATIHDHYVEFAQPPAQDDETFFDGAGGTIESSLGLPTSQIALTIDPVACTYGFTYSPALDIIGSKSDGSPPVSVPLAGVGSPQAFALQIPPYDVGDPIPVLQGTAAFPAHTVLFQGSGSRYFPFDAILPFFFLGTVTENNLSSANVVWSFDPEELELVVDPKNYDTWLPEGANFYDSSSGSAPEHEIGTSIDIEATVRRKSDGLPPQNSTVQQITFQLVQSSAEPGIALNTPPQSRLANPQPNDLQFDPALNAALRPGVVVRASDTSRGVASQGVGNTATAKVSAYDWGAFGELEVTATLDSGYVLQGQLVTDPNVKRILLPKRDANSKIADEWKQQHNVATKADSADDEDNPGGNGQHLGDGVSLYEEYRGFFVGGLHPRGGAQLGGGQKPMDPLKKDLFVKNDYGPVLVPGFKILADGGRLNVHHQMLDEEIDAGSVVNYNAGQGAHVVDQHGVRVVQGNCGKNFAGHANADPIAGAGAGCPTGECLRLLPRTTTSVCIAPEGVFPGASNIRRARVQRTVAHELAHAISVDHHGETDLREVKWVLDTQTNEVTEHSRNGSYPVELRAESGTGALSAQELAELFALASSFGELDLYVGSARGEHSGAHDCFMRYRVADAYTLEPTQQSAPRVRWWVGGEQSGTAMDASATGTGVNAGTRMPRSRYGDACSGLDRGDCRHQIRVSDALPDLVLATNGGAQCP